MVSARHRLGGHAAHRRADGRRHGHRAAAVDARDSGGVPAAAAARARGRTLGRRAPARLGSDPLPRYRRRASGSDPRAPRTGTIRVRPAATGSTTGIRVGPLGAARRHDQGPTRCHEIDDGHRGRTLGRRAPARSGSDPLPRYLRRASGSDPRAPRAGTIRVRPAATGSTTRKEVPQPGSNSISSRNRVIRATCARHSANSVARSCSTRRANSRMIPARS